jgi:multiple sugar transport system permease protein
MKLAEKAATSDQPRALTVVRRRQDSGTAWRARPGGAARAPYMMTLPFFALFTVFFVGPFLYAIYISLTSNLTGQVTGFQNYVTVLKTQAFWDGVRRMLYFGAIQVSVMIALALALALLLDSPYCRGRKIFSVIYFLPYAVPGVIAAIMWGFLLSPQLDDALRVTSVNPLGPRMVLYAIMLIVTWEFTGYNMTIYLAGITSVTKEIIDAARIDGASEWKLALSVKLPLLRRTIMFTIILSIIGTLQLFSEPAIINNLVALGGSYTPNLLIYNQAFSFGDIPLAAAGSIVLAILTAAGSVGFFLIVRRGDRRARGA